MNVKELKELLAQYPDHWPVMVERAAGDDTFCDNVLGGERENLPTSGNVVSLLTDQ